MIFWAKEKKEVPKKQTLKPPLTYDQLAVRAVKFATLTDEADRLVKRLKEIKQEVENDGGYITIYAENNGYPSGKAIEWRVFSSQPLRDSK